MFPRIWIFVASVVAGFLLTSTLWAHSLPSNLPIASSQQSPKENDPPAEIYCSYVVAAQPKSASSVGVPAELWRLPSPEVCRANYKAAQAAREALQEHLQLVGGWQGTEFCESRKHRPWNAGGWHAMELQRQVSELERLETIWWKAYWIVTEDDPFPLRQEYSWDLRNMIGVDAFLIGDLPPLFAGR